MDADFRKLLAAQLEPFDIAPDGILGQAMPAEPAPRIRLVVDGRHNPRIVLPTMIGARLAAERAAEEFRHGGPEGHSVNGEHDATGANQGGSHVAQQRGARTGVFQTALCRITPEEAGTAPGSASDGFDLGLRIIAVLAVLAAIFMLGGVLVDADNAYRLAGRV